MHVLIVRPLQPHLAKVFSLDFEQSGCLESLEAGMAKARAEEGEIAEALKSEAFNGDEEKWGRFKSAAEEECSKKLETLKSTFSPVEKLEMFLGIVEIILKNVSRENKRKMASQTCGGHT